MNSFLVLKISLILQTLSLGSGFIYHHRSQSRSQSQLKSTTYNLEGFTLTNPLSPIQNFALIKITPPAAETDGGIILTKKAQVPTNCGTCVSAGPGRSHPDSGVLIGNSISIGENVAYGKYDGTEVDYESGKHTLIRDDDAMVKWPANEELTTSNAFMVFDKLLVRVEKGEEETKSGLLLSSGAVKDKRPSVGTVIKAGPGRMAASGDLIEMEVGVGDCVKFRDFSGNEIKIGEEEFSIVRVGDCLAKY